MNFLEKILTRPEFEADPPVLVDIGASGGLNRSWKILAKYSVCLAFDPDSREMQPAQRASSAYRELHVFPRAVTSGAEGPADFYLTESPACSSLLPPDEKNLATWEFAGRFRVVKKTTVETMHIRTALGTIGCQRVDWFKTDSQGADLRLFLSLGEALLGKVMVAEFEPGIMDAYCGEDKLWRLMSAMDGHGFWMCRAELKGSARLGAGAAKRMGRFERNYLVHLLKPAPGWGEVTYLNSFAAHERSRRDYLLGWVCATILEQHGFALELAHAAFERFADAIFTDAAEESMRRIRRSYFRLPAYFPLARRALRRWKRLGFGKAAAL